MPKLRFVLTAPFESRMARLRGFWCYVVMRHPLEICMGCGRRVGRYHGFLAWWMAADELWMRVTGNASLVLCPACFTRRAEAKGVHIRWEPHQYA